MKGKRSICNKLLIVLMSVIAALIFSACGEGERSAKMAEKKEIRALWLVSKNYGLNYFLMRDVFDQFGWKVIHTGVLDSISACPPVHEQLGIHPIEPDVSLSAIEDLSEYDCLIIPPGSGNFNPVPNAFGDLLGSNEALTLIRKAVQGGLPVFAICSGSRVLAAADVIREKKMVGSPRFVEEYEAAGAIYLGNERNDHAPVIDGNIITGTRGQYYNLANCQAVAAVVENRHEMRGKRISTAKFISARSAPFVADDVVWAKTYGGPQAEGCRAICPCPDGGFIMAGYTFSHGSGDSDVLVIKTDDQGNMIWSRTYGGAGAEYGNGCLSTSDGYLVVGYTTSCGSGSKDVYLMKLDKKGKEIWSKTYGGASWDEGVAVRESADGHYVVCGHTHSFGKGEEDVYLIKTDSLGNLIWSRAYGGERLDMGNSISVTSDGGFLIGATSGSFSQNTDFFLIRTDADGQELWSRTYAAKGPRGHGFDWCNSVSLTQDGGALLAGYADCQDVMDIHVIKTDPEGREVWSKTLGQKPFYDFGNAVCESPSGDIILLGTTKSIVADKNIYNNDICLIRLDSEGNVIEEKIFDGPGSDWAGSVVLAGNGEIVAAGHTDSSGSGFFDMLLLRILCQHN
jgi:putative intracellular protease/amidase/ABC-type dipeptide/oligopeptide/nickel transport system permease subunit